MSRCMPSGHPPAICGQVRFACPPAWRSRACLLQSVISTAHPAHVTCRSGWLIGKPHTSVRACRPNSAIQVRHAVNGNLSRSTIERPQDLRERHRAQVETALRRSPPPRARSPRRRSARAGRRGRLADNGRKVPDELSIAIDAEPAARCLDEHAPVRGRRRVPSARSSRASRWGALEHDQQPGDAVPCHPTPEHGSAVCSPVIGCEGWTRRVPVAGPPCALRPRSRVAGSA